MADPREHYWSRDAAELLRDLDSSPAGLAPDEASQRLARFGPNAVRDETYLSAARLLLRQVESPLVLILVFGALISVLVQEWIDAAIVLAIVLGSVLLGFLQEYWGLAAVAQLRQRLAQSARVLRAGSPGSVPAASIVPGDIVLLAAGNLVPGDGVLLEARDFLVTEASLTGESFPVEKRPGVVPPGAGLGERTNSVFLGTSVRSGTATVLVVRTGRDTELGAIAGRLGASDPETEFARGVRRFGYLLLRVMLVMVVFVLVANQWLGRPPRERPGVNPNVHGPCRYPFPELARFDSAARAPGDIHTDECVAAAVPGIGEPTEIAAAAGTGPTWMRH